MPMLSPPDLDMLRQACREGVVKVKVVGRIADPEAEFERLKSVTVLAYLRFLEPLPADGAYARWRPVRGCSEALKRLEAGGGEGVG